MKTLEDKIMIRVHRIYFLRKFINRTAFKVYGLIALTLSLFSLVSVVNVFANMPSLTAPMHALQFILRSIQHTELLVQALLVCALIVFAFMVRDVLQNLKHDGQGSLAQI